MAETHERLPIEEAVDRFYEAFASTRVADRNRLLHASVADDVVYWTRDGVMTSQEQLQDAMSHLLEEDGQPPTLTGEVQNFHSVGRARWVQRIRGRNRSREGEAYFELGEDGRLNKIVVFDDAPHHVPLSAGVSAYIDAWNTQGEEMKREILATRWRDDARWVEIRFDVNGPEAMAATMRAPITLTPVNGVMDIMKTDRDGSQIRFEVLVSKRNGEKIGTFTDFVQTDAAGKIVRLAGFKGGSSWTRPTEEVATDWRWSYRAGYVDINGQFAGGSEIMHLASHKDRLFAANGYWTDSHWVVAEGAPRQSAQVLRLDQPDGQWEVDLDMGKRSPPELDYMKGNLLKSVTFSKAGAEVLDSPVNLLVMAAGNVKSHASVWVRDDGTGDWTHQVVHSGVEEKVNGGTRNIRWVPRDMELHTDSVTAEERIFLLLGNPGILSGVYDPWSPSSIRWDDDVEFPKEGMLNVRPLGMVSANGELYFSGGGTIYRRHDGPQPTYSEVLSLAEDLDPEMGGIRGLSAITNPHGKGESLIFMWAPDAKSSGEIIRLDPDGRGGYSVSSEVSVGSLMEQSLGGDTRAEKTLGAYNDFYPITDSVTGETVHVIGFQSVISNNDAVRGQGGYYRGARYALRQANGEYRVGEVNANYAQGKPSLVAPRTFVQGPFGGDSVYVAGYDCNFIPSTDHAWVFSTSLSTFLTPIRE
ncbi:MAG: hypothetical protein O2868_00635 [Proteobacteria bacterium]|nr:hypothetical protein [Pseudomonadota bacterium]